MELSLNEILWLNRDNPSERSIARDEILLLKNIKINF